MQIKLTLYKAQGGHSNKSKAKMSRKNVQNTLLYMSFRD